MQRHPSQQARLLHSAASRVAQVGNLRYAASSQGNQNMFVCHRVQRLLRLTVRDDRYSARIVAMAVLAFSDVATQTRREAKVKVSR